MKIIPLGTSSGQPTAERGVSGLAAFVGSPNHWVLIDCGEGVQQKMMQAKLILKDLDAILITHGHGDHCFGLFGLMAQLSMTGRSKPLKVIAPEEVRKMVQQVHVLSHTDLSYPVEWERPTAGLKVNITENLSCVCVELDHRAPSHGYLLESSKIQYNANIEAFKSEGFEAESEGFEAESVLGAAIAAAKKGEVSVKKDGTEVDMSYAISSALVKESLFVGGDNVNPDLVAKAAPGALCWVHEATYAHKDWVKGNAGVKWGHSSAKMVGEAAAKGRPCALVLTHFSSRYDQGSGPNGVERLAKEASENYKGPVFIANDLEVLTFNPTIKVLPQKDKNKKFLR